MAKAIKKPKQIKLGDWQELKPDLNGRLSGAEKKGKKKEGEERGPEDGK